VAGKTRVRIVQRILRSLSPRADSLRDIAEGLRAVFGFGASGQETVFACTLS
jgi:hypothetical protein